MENEVLTYKYFLLDPICKLQIIFEVAGYVPPCVIFHTSVMTKFVHYMCL